MSDFTDRLTLLITAKVDQAVSVIKGFGTTTTAELKNVEGAAAASGQDAGAAFAGGLAAVAGAASLIHFGKDSVQEAVDLARATASLKATLDATGGSAGVTEESINSLAEGIQKTEETFSGNVKAGAALLLTFREIQNQAGKGNDVFDRTLKVSAAVANVFGKDLTAATLQLGRAMENPQAGMQALTRQGITLSQATKEQILTFAKQGDLLSAQTTLLDELEHRYSKAGAAIAKADPLQQLEVHLKEFKAQVGGDLLPFIRPALGELEKLLDLFRELPGPVRSVVELAAAAGIAFEVAAKAKALFAVVGAFAPQRDAGEAAAIHAEAKASEEAAAATATLNKEVAGLGSSGTAGLTEVNAQLAATEELTANVAALVAALSADLGALSASGTEGAAGVEASLEKIDASIFALEGNLTALDARIATLGTTQAAGFGKFVEGDALAISEALTVAEQRVASLKAELATLGASGGGVAALDAEIGTLTAALNTAEAEVVRLKAGLATLGAGGAVGVAEAIGEITAMTAVTADAEVATTGFGASLAAAGTGALGFAAGLVSTLAPIAAVVAGLALLTKFTSTKTNTVEDLIGDPEKLKRDADVINGFGDGGFFSRIPHALGETLFHGLGQRVRQASKDFKEANDSVIASLSSGGLSAGQEQYRKLASAMASVGYSADAIASYLTPAAEAINTFSSNLDSAASSTGDLNDKVHELVGGLETLSSNFSIADAFDAIDAAHTKVIEDYADIAGTSQKAKDAHKAVADAVRGVTDAENGVVDAHQRLSDSYAHLQDAQDSVTTSLHSLSQAQHELDLYNSARGVKERALQLDIIQRRVVSTPAESDQKQLDLLKFQDDNQNKQQQLQDAVTNAQKGYRDALKGVADAQRGIVQAQQNVIDSTAKVSDAQDKVVQARAKEKQVSADASKAIVGDQRKVEEAILAANTAIDAAAQKGELTTAQVLQWGDALKTVAGQYAPGSELDKNIDTIYKKLIGFAQDYRATVIGNEFSGTANPPGSTKGRGGINPVPPGSTTGGSWEEAIQRSGLAAETKTRLIAEGEGKLFGPYTPGDLALLHQFGVPGFDTGGKVPGPTGAPVLAIVHGGEHVLTPEQASKAEKVAAVASAAQKPPHAPQTGAPGAPGSPGAAGAGGDASISVATGFTASSASNFTEQIERALISITESTVEKLPHFDQGGIVPGAPGAERLIVAHGGERVLTREEQRTSATLQVAGSLTEKSTSSTSAFAASVEKIVSSVERVSSSVDKSSDRLERATVASSEKTSERLERATTSHATSRESSSVERSSSTHEAFSVERGLTSLTERLERSSTSESASTDRGFTSLTEHFDRGTTATHEASSRVERAVSSVSRERATSASRDVSSSRDSAVERTLSTISDRLHASTATHDATSTERVLSTVNDRLERVQASTLLDAGRSTSTSLERIITSVAQTNTRIESAIKLVDRHTVEKHAPIVLHLPADAGLRALPAAPRFVPAGTSAPSATSPGAPGAAPVSVHQENHFHGKDTPSTADLEHANRELGWRLSITGRNG